MVKAAYVLRGENLGDYAQVSKEIATLTQHPGAVNLIISQAYQVDNHGTVWGAVNPRLLKFAKQNNIHFMAMLTDASFNENEVHLFLTDKNAQQKAFDTLLTLVKQNNFYGIQVDFEHISINDRDALTQFYKNLSDVLHKNNFKISAALFPLTSDIPKTTILKNIYNGWAGAYDYQQIANASDFVTIMAYNQHAGVTTPGPNAGMPWLEAVIHYTLQKISADKILLGLPVYSEYWHMVETNGHGHAEGSDISYETVQDLLKQYQAKLQWDDVQKTSYTFFNVDQFNQFIFAETAQSFQAKLQLVAKYHLYGAIIWRMGEEDPAIWQFF